MTALLNQPPPRLCFASPNVAVAADKHDLACDHVCATSAPTTVGCQAASRVAVCVCRSHVSEDAGEASLSVDFICLFGSPPDRWSVPCDWGAQARTLPSAILLLPVTNKQASMVSRPFRVK